MRAGLLLLVWCAAGTACGSATVESDHATEARRAVLVVTDETGGSLVLVDPESGAVQDRIPVGKRPRGIRATRDGSLVLVALSGSPIAGPDVDESTLPQPDRSADGIGVVDLRARRLIRTLPSGQDPEAFDLSVDGRTLFVSNEETAEMTALDLDSGTIRGRVAVGEEPEGVTVHPDGQVVYVACEADNAVFVVDTASLQVLTTIPTGARPRMIAFTRDGGTAFVSDENTASVTVVDARKHVPAGTIRMPPIPGAPTAPRPMGLALSPDGRQLLVSLGRAQAVAVVDVAERAIVRTITGVGTRPWGIAVSRDSSSLYTANGPSGDIAIIDMTSGDVRQRVATGGSPWGVIVADASDPEEDGNQPGASADSMAASPQLRVCADPNNLPFSNERREGFENRLADLLARELGAEVRYTWWAQRRGFVRNTLNARECDVIMGIAADVDLALTTRPYYRSSYAFVTRRDRQLTLASLDDERLRRLRVGVQLIGDDGANAPPAHALGRRGIIDNVVGYSVFGNYVEESPPSRIVNAVAAGEIDVALAWGPLAGYFAAKQPIALDVRPLQEGNDGELPLAFDIAMAVRRADRALRDRLNAFIERRRPEIDAILDDYHVPRVPVRGR